MAAGGGLATKMRQVSLGNSTRRGTASTLVVHASTTHVNKPYCTTFALQSITALLILDLSEAF